MDALAIKPQALDDARAALAELPVKHYNEKEARRCQLEEQFPQWAFQLRLATQPACYVSISVTTQTNSQGFSVLLYGFGSKRRLLDAFLGSRPSHQAVVAVDGRAPGITARQVLLKVAHEHGRASMAQLRCDVAARQSAQPHHLPVQDPARRDTPGGLAQCRPSSQPRPGHAQH